MAKKMAETFRRADAEAEVRAIGRHCRGPLPPQGTELTPQLRRMLAQQSIELAGTARNAPGRDDVRRLLDAGDLDAAREADRIGRVAACLVLFNRAECGYDFNEIIVAGPFDGLEHKYTCPQCGLEGSYRAPWFEGLTEHLAAGE